MKFSILIFSIVFILPVQSCSNRSCDYPAEVRTLEFYSFDFSNLDSAMIFTTDANNNTDTAFIQESSIIETVGQNRHTVRLSPYLTAGNTYIIKLNNGRQFEIKDFEFNTVECKESTFARKEDVLRLGVVKVNGYRVSCIGNLRFYP